MKKLFSLIAVLFPLLVYGQTPCSPVPQAGSTFGLTLSNCSQQYDYQESNCYPNAWVHEQFAVGYWWIESPIEPITHHYRLFHAEWITDQNQKVLCFNPWRTIKTKADVSCLAQSGIKMTVISNAPSGYDRQTKDLDRYIRGSAAEGKGIVPMNNKAGTSCVFHVSGCRCNNSLAVDPNQKSPALHPSPAKAKRASH
jgi:hypothetical protein